MSELPRIFVSHSSLDAALTRAVCERLAPAPGRWGYDVLVDYTELKPGVEWPRHLHEYMARCHAAVLLLTPQALASPWVLKEATILAWRHALDPTQFKLFPVRLPEVTDEALEAAKYGPLMLGLVQKIGSGDPDAIAQAVRTAVGAPDTGVATPFDKLVGRLTDLLARAGPETLKDIAERISVAPPAWRPDLDLRAQYVTQIARRVLSEQMGGFAGVHELVDALSFTPAPDNVKQVFRIVAPFWVDAQAAGRLPQVRKSQPRVAAALNGVHVAEFTALSYVRRAHPLSLAQTIVAIAGGAGGDPVAHVEREVCTWMREKEGMQGSDDAIVQALAQREQNYYAVLPDPVDDESLAAILERFPTIAFILWTGETLDRDPPLARVDWIEPALDPAKEQQAFWSCREAMRILKRMESTSL